MALKAAATWMCCLLTAGCADLSAVRDISSRLSVASKDWNDVSGDIAGSCRREMTLNPQLVDCQLETKASEGLVAADAVLNNYFGALLAAATESNFTVKPGLDKVAGAVASIPNINQGQVKAVSGLIGLLVKVSLEKMREDTLRELIREGGPPAQSVVDALHELVVPGLKSRLEAEKVQLLGYFGKAILTQRDAIGLDPERLCSGSEASRFSATGFLLAQEFCKRLVTLSKRQKALVDYEASLDAASAALKELQSSSADLKAAALATKLYAIGKELDENIAAVRKAFG